MLNIPIVPGVMACLRGRVDDGNPVKACTAAKRLGMGRGRKVPGHASVVV